MKIIGRSLKSLLLFTLLTGIFYPLIITAISQVLFPWKSNGSLIIRDNKITGSKLIGQQFDSLRYFHSRPSMANYNALTSGGSNLSITNSKLKELVLRRKKQFFSENNTDSLLQVPAEMLFASASGLDPHISPEAALLQADRVAMARNYNEKQKESLKELIKNQTEKSQFFILGPKRVNVLLLNLMTDSIK
jgi:potassium-transporting ATPase KdpC subunit